MRKSHKDFLGALIIVGLSLLGIEIALRVFDPFGLHYFEDVAAMSANVFVIDPQRGYILRDGNSPDVNIQQGRRVVPDSAETDCTLAFLGDSVTFGGGVTDAQAWVNLLARDLPDITVLNYGVPRYNAENVALTRLAEPEHDAYIYTVFNNDSEPGYNPATDALVVGYQQPWLVLYMQFLLRREQPAAPVDTGRVFRALDTMLKAGPVHFVAFEDDVLTDAIVDTGYAVHVVPYPPYPISVADFHLNPYGNAVLAESLLPFVRGVADAALTRCND